VLTDYDLAQIAREAPHLRPLLDHAYLRNIALDVPTRASWQGHGGLVDIMVLPHIVLIRDDDPHTGPDEWLCIPRLHYWAEDGMCAINPSPGCREHYERAAELARRNRRMVLVDCPADAVFQWHSAFGGSMCTKVLGRPRRPDFTGWEREPNVLQFRPRQATTTASSFQEPPEPSASRTDYQPRRPQRPLAPRPGPLLRPHQ
jgi:hypothetical protein